MKGLVLALAAAASVVTANPAVAAKARPAKKSELAVVLKALQDRVNDPESVRLKNVVVNVSKEGMLSACGEVNAKNSFGGYVGFRPFFVATTVDGSDSGEPLVTGLGKDDAPVVEKMCSKFVLGEQAG